MLVLAAFPAEIAALLEEAERGDVETITVDDRRFYVGTLRGSRVVLALTGIGLVNAEEVTRLSFEQFRCGERPGISGVVVSGVGGGPYIGDVMVPRRWTEDGTTFAPVDRRMLSTARRIVRNGGVRLARQFPVGEDATYHNIPLEPVRGHDQIRATVERIEFRVVNLAADGEVVLTERIDAFVLSDRPSSCPSWVPSRCATEGSRRGATTST